MGQKFFWPTVVLAGFMSGPALADECWYRSGLDQGTLAFVDGGAVLTSATGKKSNCSVTFARGTDSTLSCDGYPVANWSFAASVFDGDIGEELISLWDHVWYGICE